MVPSRYFSDVKQVAQHPGEQHRVRPDQRQAIGHAGFDAALRVTLAQAPQGLRQQGRQRLCACSRPVHGRQPDEEFAIFNDQGPARGGTKKKFNAVTAPTAQTTDSIQRSLYEAMTTAST